MHGVYANRPTSGPIYDEMKTSKKNIRKRIRHLRATSVRKSIKHFDDLFQSRSHHRFKLSKLVNSYCNKIRTSNGIVNDSAKIAEEFSLNFSSLLLSRLDPVLNQNHFTSAYKEYFCMGPSKRGDYHQ